MSLSALPSVVLRCAGCAAVVDPLDALTPNAFRCPNADRAPNIDHVLAWDAVSAGVTEWPQDAAINPFVRYRTLHHSYWLARSHGLGDADYVTLANRLDRALSGVDRSRHGFIITPFDRCDALSDVLLEFEVWAKDETGNIGGSHKARHLMGLLLHLEVQKVGVSRRLAIVSCGNAALAAATLAKAARRPIDVFVPPSANPVVLEHLKALGASITVCPRRAGDPPGDPCVLAFRQAVKRGSLPFCCQGNENGLTIDGGATIGQELADQLSISGLDPTRIVVQVGGGALGTSLMRGLGHASLLGYLPPMPPLHFVQSEGAAPLHRAWVAVANRALSSLDDGMRADDDDDAPAVAARLLEPDAATAVSEALRHAATHRSNYMWPWEDEPFGVATGILDDETYDWLSLVGAMLCTGGWPVVVDDGMLLESNAISGSQADETGTAGLAGLLALHQRGMLRSDERAVVLFTGIRR